MSKRKKVYRVQWLDSVGPQRYWSSADDLPARRELVCDTVGWLVEEHKDRITMASTLHLSELGGTITIPRVAIIRMARYRGEK